MCSLNFYYMDMNKTAFDEAMLQFPFIPFSSRSHLMDSLTTKFSNPYRVYNGANEQISFQFAKQGGFYMDFDYFNNQSAGWQVFNYDTDGIYRPRFFSYDGLKVNMYIYDIKYSDDNVCIETALDIRRDYDPENIRFSEENNVAVLIFPWIMSM